MEKGSSLLKLTGVLMILSSIIVIVFYALLLLGVGFIAELTKGIGDELKVGVSLVLIIALVAAAIQFIAGCIGVKYHKQPDKAGACLAFAVVIILIAGAGVMFGIIESGFDTSHIVSISLGMVVPLLYLLGALHLRDLNKK